MRASRGLVAAVGASIAGGILWFVSGLAIFAVSWSSTRWEPAIALALPATVPVGTWQQLAPWNVVLPSLGALLFSGLLGLALGGLLCWRQWQTASSGIRFLGGWIAVVAAAFITAGCWALGDTIANSYPTGLEWAFRTAQPQLLASGFFGVVWGWVPALVFVAFLGRSGRDSSAQVGQPAQVAQPAQVVQPAQADGAAGSGTWHLLPVVFVVVAILTVGAGVGVVAAQPAAVRAGRIAAGGTPDGRPLPSATPKAVPEPLPPSRVAPTPVSPGPDWCAPGVTSLTVSGVSGALGHRALTMVLVNRSGTACVVDGYPDVAFADADGHSLIVRVQHGSSYMATDPGAEVVNLAPGTSAEAQLSWDATGASTGTATTLWAATYPGAQRTQLSIETDITESSVISVTAWALATATG
jgi:hypothetical protein